MPEITNVAFVGGGSWARHHMRLILQQPQTSRIVAICEPDEAVYSQAAAEFTAFGVLPPPHLLDLDTLLSQADQRIDAVFIVTPHARHHDQVKRCLEAGLDVIVEKPMVITAEEAASLIETRDRTGRLLVVAFQGSLSPQIREAVRMIQGGRLGQVLNVSGVVWQDWKRHAGSWRTVPALSGGGFLFDTGAHMLNTVADLVGEDFADVSAWFDNRGLAVEVLGAIVARTKSGILVTINACGDTIPSCESDIRVFGTQGILRTGQWGERLDFQPAGRRRLQKVKVDPSLGVWEQFLKIRAGEISNSSPPEIGLRMARLWDAVRASAAQDGARVNVDTSQ
ncbi:MAG: Gfo/Idh/MocA family oxidoreductase [Anaerolineae bacterium]|nr:Gfo/Idh/MocA family oxidoreductase [Anaerolineae bacterium]